MAEKSTYSGLWELLCWFSYLLFCRLIVWWNSLMEKKGLSNLRNYTARSDLRGSQCIEATYRTPSISEVKTWIISQTFNEESFSGVMDCAHWDGVWGVKESREDEYLMPIIVVLLGPGIYATSYLSHRLLNNKNVVPSSWSPAWRSWELEAVCWP